jgi:peptide/nickel transport system permease protein
MSEIFRQLRKSPIAMAGAIVFALLIVVAFIAPLIAPMDPGAIDIRMRLSPPAWANGGSSDHFFGTDNVGRDVLSRIIYGARVSLLVGVSTVAIGGVTGAILGLIAGYYRGWVETVIMRLVDIQLAFPSILLAVAIMALVGPSLINVIFVLSLATWAPFCRVARGQTLQVCNLEYITAAEALGLSNFAIVVRHVIPNIINPLIVVASFALATNIINEASLSFLGVGVPPSTPTWGGMLGEGRNYLRIAWWVSTLPGIALMISVYSVNMLGDWLRDYYDPRLID